MTRAPMPSRLLFVPVSRTISQRRPGACRSATVPPADPSEHDDDIETAVAVEVGHAASPVRGQVVASRPPAVASRNRPWPSLMKRLLGCRNSTASKSPMRSFTWELAVKMSFQPSLSTSATIEHQPDDLTVSAARPARLRHLDERPATCAVVAEERKRLARERGEVDVLPAVVVVVLGIGAHARGRPARCRAPTPRRGAPFP